jgi:predicted  nucleic acid-binding Zn-ribbon protein
MLDRLVNLQNTDEKIVAFEKEEARIPEELEAREDNIAGTRQERDAVQAEVDDILAQLADIERELDEAKDNQRRSQARTLAVKTQREYQAVQREGEMARKRRGELEAQIKELTEEKGAVESTLGELVARLTEEESQLAESKGQADEKLKQLVIDREDLEKTREVEAGLLDPDLLTRYQKVFERYRGQGVVKVIHGVCNGCYMTVPPQLFNQVLEGISIHQCPNCGRIIYVEEV